jgi:hypothetical protein
MHIWMRISRAIPLAVAVALTALAPASALGATWNGAVVARDPARTALVVALDDGTARTVRSTGWKAIKVARRVAVTADRLGDGTYGASALHVVGKASLARFRATVVRRSGRRVLVSAGGSLVTIRVPRTVTLAAAPLASGVRVVVQEAFAHGGASASVQPVGTVGLVQLEGTVLQLSAGVLTVQTPDGPLDVQLRPGVDSLSFDTGAEVSLLAAIGPDGTLDLELSVDDSAADVTIDFNEETGELDVGGTVVSIDSENGTITIDPGDGSSPVTCTVPTDADLTSLAPGDPVVVSCSGDGGTLTASVVVSDNGIVVTVGDGTTTETIDVCALVPGLCELLGENGGGGGGIDPCQLLPGLCDPGDGTGDGSGGGAGGGIDPCAILPELCEPV